MVRFATWLALYLVAGSASGAVIHVFPKFGAVYNPNRTLADPAVIAAVDPLVSLDLAPRREPYLVRFDFLMTIEDLTGEQLGFGNVVFNINLQGVEQSSALPGWIGDTTLVDGNGAIPGGIRQKWAFNGDYGPSTSDLQSIIIGTQPLDFLGPRPVDPRWNFGIPPNYNNYNLDQYLVINQSGAYWPPWEGSYAGSLFVEISGQRGSEGVVNTFVEEGSTYNAARLLSDEGVIGAPPANFRIRVVPEPSTRWLLLDAVVALLIGAVAGRRRHATRMPWRVLCLMRESFSGSGAMRFIRAQASVVAKDYVARRPLAQFCLGMVLASALVTASSADIYRWDNGALIPGTEGITPGPDVQLDNLDLSYAKLINRNLSGGSLAQTILRRAQLNGAKLKNANLSEADFETADLGFAQFNDANIEGASFYRTGFTKEQLYSTLSYKSRRLVGIDLGANDLRGWNLSGQDLTNAGLYSNLTGTDFTDAYVAGAQFSSYLTKEQLLSTASYREGQLAGIQLESCDLQRADFGGHNLANSGFGRSALDHANFNGANLANAKFNDALLGGATFSGSIVVGVQFEGVTWKGERKFRSEQLYSTASYQVKDLSRIWLRSNILDGWDFHDQNMTNSNLSETSLVAADLHGAILRDSNLSFTQLTNADLSGAELTNADLSRAVLINADLTGSSLADGKLNLANLTAAQLVDADLTGVNLRGATLTNTRFDGAMIAGARLDYSTLNNFTKEQLYATASYRNKNLSAIGLAESDLHGWSFAGQDLSSADFSSSAIADADLSGANLSGANLQSAVLTNAALNGANLSQADLTGADLRNASDVDLTGASVPNTIRPDGTVINLNVAEGDRFLVRDYDGDPVRQLPPLPIAVVGSASLFAGSVLQLEFEADLWNSIISFKPGIPVELGGTLEFTFAEDVDVVSQIGRTIRVFDWSGVDPTGAFSVSSRYPWDVSQLYTSGEVTLLLPGDTNGDGVVSIKDLNNVVNNFGGTGLGDTNGDLLVNLVDLNNVRNFFRVSTPQAVPEPSTFVLLVVAFGGAALRARGFHRW